MFVVLHGGLEAEWLRLNLFHWTFIILTITALGEEVEQFCMGLHRVDLLAHCPHCMLLLFVRVDVFTTRGGARYQKTLVLGWAHLCLLI